MITQILENENELLEDKPIKKRLRKQFKRKTKKKFTMRKKRKTVDFSPDDSEIEKIKDEITQIQSDINNLISEEKKLVSDEKSNISENNSFTTKTEVDSETDAVPPLQENDFINGWDKSEKLCNELKEFQFGEIE